MTIVSRPADNGSVRGNQAAAAAVLVKFLTTYDLPAAYWTLYDGRSAGKISGQIDPDQRGDEQLASYMAMWAEVIDGTFSRTDEIEGEARVFWRVQGVYEGVEVHLYTTISVEYDAVHDLPTVAVAEETLERQAEEAYAEMMLTAAERLEQTIARVRPQIDRPGSLLHATDEELAAFAEASERALAARVAG